jgi:hypothetical protein
LKQCLRARRPRACSTGAQWGMLRRRTAWSRGKAL